MAYIRHDENCDPVSPQPGKTTVNQFSGNEGWSTVTYENFNADYQARNTDNTARTPGTYQARILTTLLELLQRISVTIKITIQ